MFATCWFDMFDTCMRMEWQGIGIELPNAEDHVVLSGQYMLPAGLNPLGMSASQLLSFGIKALRQPIPACED